MKEIDYQARKRIKNLFANNDFNDCVLYENDLYMPRMFEQKLKIIKNFELREDDIWIVTYPKSGTTWTQELVWTLVNDVDIGKIKMPLFLRSPWIDCLPPFMNENGDIVDSVDYISNMKERRIIKTHLPMEFLPENILEKCKVVYVARKPKDVAVSAYHHVKNIPLCGYIGGFGEFMDFFMGSLVHYGHYWHHILGAWNRRNHENMKFLWYEDMKSDQMSVINELCDFLKHPLAIDQKVQLFKHVQFENMKSNPFSSPAPTAVLDQSIFFRKGSVGDWKNYFDKAQAKQFEDWIQNNIKGTTLEKLQQFK